jgi:hypothetical protein
VNINQKIAELGTGGLPRYNRKINELIETVNWLMGMQTTTGKISEGGRGPIIDTAPVAGTAAQPWLTDPDGNQAGWLKVLVLNPNQGPPPGLTCWEQWIWTSNTLTTAGLPWLVDPNGAVAHWLMGANGGVWGTGMYPTGVVGNFISGYAVYTGAMAPDGNGPAYHSPFNFTINPSGGNIPNIPTNPPAFYIKANPAPGGASGGPQITIGGGSQFVPIDTVDWELDIIYDGTKVLSYSGSATVSQPPGSTDVLLDPTGWVFDPTGLPGYSHGSGMWIWEYPGSISANPNPTINQNFVFSSVSGWGWCNSFAGNGQAGFVYLTS